MRLQANSTVLKPILFSVLINLNSAFLPSMAKEPTDACADLQRIMNKIAKKQGQNVTFHGFENLSMQTDVYSYSPKTGTDRLCQLGYRTEISPMGKQICRAHIYTNTRSTIVRASIGYFRTSMYDDVPTESEFCRWL